MNKTGNEHKGGLTEAVMLSRLQRADEMREFFIEMWKQNPALAKQGGARVKSLLDPLDQFATETKPFSRRGKGGDGGIHD